MTNWGYIDFAENLIACWQAQKVSNHLMVALDAKTADHWRASAPLVNGHPLQWTSITDIGQEDNMHHAVFDETGESFGTLGFRSICNVKAWLVRQLLAAGISVLWTDTDIVWLDDAQAAVGREEQEALAAGDAAAAEFSFQERVPFHLCNRKLLVPVEGDSKCSTRTAAQLTPPTIVDMVFQSDDDGVCAGFYLARANERTVRYFDMVLQYLNPAIDDQLAMRRMLHSAQCPLAAVLVLSRIQFPNGSAFFQHKLPQRRGVDRPTIVHNNCVIGHDHKRRRFEQFGLWFASQNAGVVVAAEPAGSRAPFRLAAVLKGHTEAASGVCFVKDDRGASGVSRSLVSVSYDRTLRLWSPTDPSDDDDGGGSTYRLKAVHYVHLRGGPFSVLSLAGDSAGKKEPHVLIGAHDCSASIRPLLQRDSANDTRSSDGGDNVVTFSGHSLPVNAVAVDAAGTTVFTASDDETVGSWQLTSGQRIRWFVGHTGWVTDCAVHGSAVLFTASRDGTVRAWQVATGRCMAIYKTVGGAWARCVRAVVGRGGRLLVLAGDTDGLLYCWDARTGDLLASARFLAGINCMEIISNDNDDDDDKDIIVVVVVGLESGSLGRVNLVLGSGCLTLPVIMETRCHEPYAIRSISSQAGLLAAGSDDGTISVWQILK